MSSKRAALAPLAKPLPSGRTVSLSAFAFLYGEMVSYFQARTTSMADLETRLDNAGYGIGVRLLELTAFKDRPAKRDITVLSALQFVSGTLWTHLFGKTADTLQKTADTLQKSTDTANACEWGARAWRRAWWLRGGSHRDGFIMMHGLCVGPAAFSR